MDTYHISNIDLTFKEILSWNGLPKKLKISSLAEKAIIKCHTYLKAKTENSDIPYYGINTGFGALCDKKIAKNDLRALQKNLILSHCCGVGELVDSDIVKWMMLLKVISLSKGHSGSQLETIQLLIELYNNDVIPEVFQQGSLGASGDLAPLAHMSLAIIGEGHVIYKGRRRICGEVLTELNLKPIELDRKEGLALLNGTQFMLAHGIHVLIQADNLMKWAIAASALSIDAYNSRLEPFNSLIHKVRKQTGQKDIAASILNLLEGSAISTQAKSQVQDPYSFRCIPQVLGATLDGLRHVTDIVVNEINAVTDNPIIFPDEDLILSGGNFHGQPLAVNFDYLAIVMSEVASISERRIYRLLSGARQLPKFLINDPGLNSGFMIPQYTAASLVNQNKQLCSPNSVDSIESSDGQEDHVSMGGNAAIKLIQILKNVELVIAMEMLCAAQALDFRAQRSSTQLEAVRVLIRQKSIFNAQDRYLKEDIDSIKELLSKPCPCSIEY